MLVEEDYYVLSRYMSRVLTQARDPTYDWPRDTLRPALNWDSVLCFSGADNPAR